MTQKLVKEIQGTTGVHILLDPQSDDTSEALSAFDLRLPISESSSQSKGYGPRYGSGSTVIGRGYSVGGDHSATDGALLITVRVLNLANRTIDLSIVSNIPGNSSGKYCIVHV